MSSLPLSSMRSKHFPPDFRVREKERRSRRRGASECINKEFYYVAPGADTPIGMRPWLNLTLLYFRQSRFVRNGSIYGKPVLPFAHTDARSRVRSRDENQKGVYCTNVDGKHFLALALVHRTLAVKQPASCQKLVVSQDTCYMKKKMSTRLYRKIYSQYTKYTFRQNFILYFGWIFHYIQIHDSDTEIIEHRLI